MKVTITCVLFVSENSLRQQEDEPVSLKLSVYFVMQGYPLPFYDVFFVVSDHIFVP